jgi:hypothetical protein
MRALPGIDPNRLCEAAVTRAAASPLQVWCASMLRRWLSILLVVAGACGGSSDAAPKTLTGVITEVSWNEDHTQVESFLVDSRSEVYEIRIDPRVDYGFDLSHLEQHRETHDPVRVQLREREGELFAQRIDDA